MLYWRMLGSFSRSPLQAHTRDPNGHSQVSPAPGTPPSSHKYVDDNDTQPTYLLAHSLAHSLTQSLTHLLTHSLQAWGEYLTKVLEYKYKYLKK